MGLLAKKTIRTLALICISIFLICNIIAIVLTGIQYRYVGPDFINNPFHAIPGLEVATMVYTFVIAIFGILVFAKPNITMTIIFAILLLTSLLFNFSVSVITFVAASHGWVNTYLGCNGNYNGIMGAFNGIDSYLQIADQQLCSSRCPCYLNNVTGFEKNDTLKDTFSTWDFSTTLSTQAVAFTNCTSLHEETYRLAKENNKSFDPENSFNSAKFFDYMKRIEEQFKCSGWCSAGYFDPRLNKNVLMGKYLFRDVNLGPPTYFGCLNEVITWVPVYLNAWGSVVMVLFGFQTITLILALCQCWAREKDHEQQVPHHHDDVRQ